MGVGTARRVDPTLEWLAAFVPTCRSLAGLWELDLIGACPDPRESCQLPSQAQQGGEPVITIGVDAHKQMHVAVALDETGRPVGQWQGANASGAWRNLHQWAKELGPARRWGIEGAWNYGRGCAQHLVGAGEEVYDVNPRWTAQGCRRARSMAKNDRLDAKSVAMVILRETVTLPRVQADDDTAVLDLLVTQRDDALAEATRLRNQIHQLLLQIDPEYRSHVPNLQSQAGLKAVETYPVPEDRSLGQERAKAIRRLAERLRLALRQAEELTEQIEALAQEHYAPLTQLCGINLLTAATLAGILGPGQRFATEAQLAFYAGVAPLEASSAARTRHRLNRGGNRRLNAVLYRIALTQARYSPEARGYLQRRRGEGKTGRE